MTAKDLKNALLQEAVQGKLVPQIATEGNARDLLEEIRKEKAKLVKEGKLKKEKPLPEITDKDIPFDIPNNWCWCRLGEIVNKLTDGSHNPPPAKTSGYPVISAMNIKNGKIILDNVNRYTDQQGFDKENPRTNITSGDIILGIIGGSIGNIAIYNLTEKVIAQRSIAIINTTVNNIYISLLLQSPYIQSQLQDSKGTAQGGVYLGSLKSLCIPLPPLAEQKRIVAAIEKFIPLIEEYGKKETELKAFNEQIGTLTKKAILQEAVQGKLVPQIAAEGNARDLLDEIRKERLSHGLDFANAKSGKRKSKKETALAGSNPCDISDDEIPFDIPENWFWCRLGEICTKLVDGDHNPPAGLQEKTEYLMLSSRNINDDKLVDLDLVRYLSKEVFEKENERTKAEKGDIFFTSVGTLGRSCIFDGSINVSFQRSVSIIKTEIFNYYLKYCLDSGYVQNFVVKNATGTAQKGFYLNQLAELIIPLPPLAEQKRIVAAIEKMLPLCDKLGA